MGNYRKLRVWRLAHALMLGVHRAASEIRGGEYLSLRSQMIRAAASISTNIVEGRSRRSEREFKRFLDIAIASSRELEYLLECAVDLGVMDEDTFRALRDQVTDVRRMLYGLMAKLDESAEKSKQDGSEVVSGRR